MHMLAELVAALYSQSPAQTHRFSSFRTAFLAPPACQSDEKQEGLDCSAFRFILRHYKKRVPLYSDTARFQACAAPARTTAIYLRTSLFPAISSIPIGPCLPLPPSYRAEHVISITVRCLYSQNTQPLLARTNHKELDALSRCCRAASST